MEEKILKFILDCAEERKVVPFSMIEEEFNIMMDDKLKSVVAEALWDIDTVSDALVRRRVCNQFF